ncbi:MAG: biosynthetic-type acetolactate synthase large subunit [Candidatus Methanomethylophilaceae archaeon]|nr:biosynthetic-type acetolactate synthase large subunit [Candidatus Methanomethylophilaceae archaeon]
MKGSKALLNMLADRGVEKIFGYPGGQVIPIFDEIIDSSIENVLVRHEQCAAHMADGFSRASGRTGVCLATSGPGATNLVTGVATAYADSVPMMVLTGQVASSVLGMGAFQEVDAFSLMMPVTKYNYRVLELPQLPKAMDQGWKLATVGRPGPVHIDLPVDSITSDIDEGLLTCNFSVLKPVSDLSNIPAATEIIRSARSPVILAGGGVIGSDTSEDVVRFAEMIGAPVITPMMGIGCIPYDHPLSLGSLGMHGKMSALDAIKSADVLIVLGARFSDRTYSKRTSISPGCKVIHVDIDCTEFDKRLPATLNIHADLRDAIGEMMRHLGPFVPKEEWAVKVAGFKAKCSGCNIDLPFDPIVPQKVMHEINKILDDNTIITTDVGQNQMWAMHHLKINRPRQFISSGSLGTMGFGLPSALGAKVACPEKKVMTITGDGGLLMVIQELATAVAEDLPIVICLLNNGWLGLVKQWQKLFWDKRYSSTRLYDSNPDFVKLAEAFGAKGIRVEKPGDVGDALKQAFASDKPCLLDIICNPEEDMLPMIPNNPAQQIVRGRCQY